MKILLAVSEYHRGGGFPRNGVNLARALVRRGHEVAVLTRRAEVEEEDRAISFRTYALPERPLWRHLAAEPRVLTRLLNEQAGEFDVAVSVGVSVFAPVVLVAPGTQRGYLETTLASLPRTSPRRWIEGARPFHRILMRSERRMIRERHPSLVVVGAERFVAEYTEAYGFPRERVAIVHYGVEGEEFHPDAAARDRTRAALGVSPAETVMVNVANRGRQKGLDVLAEALHLVPRESRWRFFFAGSGSTSRMLSRRTADLRREGRVALLGRVESTAALYNAADLLVFPSRYDPWGMVVTEAMACGTPALASAAIGSATAIVPGVNGDLIANPTDAGEVARRITATLARRFDREAVAASVRHLSWDHVAELFEEHLEPLAGARGGAR